MSKVKQRFQATDGADFDTKEAAERHNKSVELAEKLAQCVREVNRHLGAGAMTADGEPFTFSGWADYWTINEWVGMPRLAQIEVWAHDINFETDRNDGELVVRVRQRREYQEDRIVQYRVSSLYAHKRNAEAALIAATERHIAELQADLEKMKAAVKK